MTSLWAVHIADGVLAPVWLVGGYLATAALAWLGSRRLRDEEVPRIGVFTAAFFIASLIHVPIVIGGQKAHLLLNGLVGVVLGPRAMLAIPLGLALQALLFLHGGLTALGVNACVMGLPALTAAVGFQAVRRWVPPTCRATYGVAGLLLGTGAVLITAALNFVVLARGSVAGTDLLQLARVSFILHLPLAVVEGLVTASLVTFLLKVKPEVLGLPATRRMPDQRPNNTATAPPDQSS
jgi:cobalt/nickel transport system permease protein